MERLSEVLDFYKDKRVLVTGHTGFKGAWLSKILINAGAELTGYALEAPTEPSLFELTDIKKSMNSVIGDIRDYGLLYKTLEENRPEIVIHMAAQPLVRDSYEKPAYTYETNVMGTVNICEAIRLTNCVNSFLNVTTDKVYLNNETGEPFKEDDALDGYDPYSNSKSCSELVTHSYKRSFFDGMNLPVSTARAGNVIGGGDFSDNRIIPDCIKAAEKNEPITVRNPYSVRPYQHVLEPLFAYLTIAKAQYEDIKFSGYYNIGPDKADCVTTKELVEIFCKAWGGGQTWRDLSDGGPHEAGLLMLDNTKIKDTFGLKPVWGIKKAVEKTVEFGKARISGDDLNEAIDRQIKEYEDAAKI